MSVLDTMNPQRVMHYFAEICAIPHGSGNTQALSNYLRQKPRPGGLSGRGWERGADQSGVAGL